MQTIDKLEVYYCGIKVGTMAPWQKYRTAFEYSDQWLREGRNPSAKDLLAVAKKAGIKEPAAKQIIERVQDTVNSSLAKYLK